MTTVLISQHSSNPFEATSSPGRSRGQAYRDVRDAQRLGTEDPSDPLSGFEPHTNEQKDYWSHIQSVVPNMRISQEKMYGLRSTIVTKTPASQRYIDLDESSDDTAMHYRTPGRSNDAMDVDEGARLFTDHIDVDAEDDLEYDESEEVHMKNKDPAERLEIEAEMEDLNRKVSQLRNDYKLVDRLGTGTFSSVYKAVDLRHHKWDNTTWRGHHPPSSSAHYQSIPHPRNSTFYVAIKRIYVTSSPERIRNEIAIMKDCLGCRHVSQLITAFRHKDQVVAIMPYQKNEDFRVRGPSSRSQRWLTMYQEFYTSLPMDGIKAYLRCMFRGLRDIHARAIIHRDVKPANFLYDPFSGVGTLCDFGLASVSVHVTS